jgi:prolyl-tRNA synthetase
MIGAIIMAHGDDIGLRLPPRMAPIQVVIVPIFRNTDEGAPVLEASEGLRKSLVDAGLRVHVDTRDGQRPGFKFNDWEMRGVPLRIEIGPKDLEQDTVILARRDIPGREAKQSVSRDGLVARAVALLDEIQENMLNQATEFRDKHIHEVRSYDELKQVVEAGGWARGSWAGSDDDERRIKDETGATLRCIPFEDDTEAACFLTGKSDAVTAYFARAY